MNEWLYSFYKQDKPNPALWQAPWGGKTTLLFCPLGNKRLHNKRFHEAHIINLLFTKRVRSILDCISDWPVLFFACLWTSDPLERQRRAGRWEALVTRLAKQKKLANIQLLSYMLLLFTCSMHRPVFMQALWDLWPQNSPRHISPKLYQDRRL